MKQPARSLASRGPPVLVAALLLAACGGDTGRGRTHFDFEVSGAPGASFTTSAGYEVALSEARLSLARVEFFEGEPLFSARTLERLVVSVAHAHPGHYQEGEALADVLTPAVVDLLAAPHALEGDGVTGDYRSARIALSPDPALGGSAVVTGTARRDGAEFPFSGRLRLDEAVTGVAVGHAVSTAEGRFSLKVHLETWLDRVEFDEVGPSAELEPDTQPHNAWLRGVRNTSAYRFEFEEGE